MEGLVAIICLFVILPGMVLWFVDRRARRKGPKDESVQIDNSDLLRLAERMEQRIEALEKILDAEAPNWRSRHHG